MRPVEMPGDPMPGCLILGQLLWKLQGGLEWDQEKAVPVRFGHSTAKKHTYTHI